MTEDDFRRLALGLPEAVESAHMAHPDFREGGKIFATLRAERLMSSWRKQKKLRSAMHCGLARALARRVVWSRR
jgi:hypothetical protein